MSTRKGLFLFCLIGAVVCLASGYASVGQWLGVAAALLPGLALLLVLRYPSDWLILMGLVGFVVLAAVGVLNGAPSFLMILGAAAALASWDLANLVRTMKGASSQELAPLFEKSHAQFLALALFLGVLMAGLGTIFSLQVPFVILIALVLVNLYSLDRANRYLSPRS